MEEARQCRMKEDGLKRKMVREHILRIILYIQNSMQCSMKLKWIALEHLQKSLLSSKAFLQFQFHGTSIERYLTSSFLDLSSSLLHLTSSPWNSCLLNALLLLILSSLFISQPESNHTILASSLSKREIEWDRRRDKKEQQ